MSEGIPYGCLTTAFIAMLHATGVMHSYAVVEVSMRGCLIAGRDKDHHALFMSSGVIDSRCKSIDYQSWQTRI